MSLPSKGNNKDPRPNKDIRGLYKLRSPDTYYYDPINVDDAVAHVLGLGLPEIVGYDGSPNFQREVAEEHAKAYFPHLFASEVCLDVTEDSKPETSVIPLTLASYTLQDGSTDWGTLREKTLYAVTSTPLQLTV